jgi:hypothetical protein
MRWRIGVAKAHKPDWNRVGMCFERVEIGLNYRIFVDSSGNGEMRWYNEMTGEFRKRKVSTKKTLHELESLAVVRAIKDSLAKASSGDKIEICCDRETVVNQLNHKAGIKDDSVRTLADSAWSLSYKAKLEKNVEVKFVWVSRKNNPAGKMLGV